MQFILNLTIREIRSSWRRLLFFFLCIAIGVGSVVALRSLIFNLSQAVGTDARALLTADFEVSTTNTFTPDDITRIESVINKSNIIEARNEAITTAAMARPVGQEGLQFVELKGIEPPFPLVGNFTFSDGKPFDFKILENKGAVVAPLLLEKLNLKIGDKIKIGETDFEIRATFDEEPGGQSGFRLGPRVFIEKKAFEETGLKKYSQKEALLSEINIQTDSLPPDHVLIQIFGTKENLVQRISQVAAAESGFTAFNRSVTNCMGFFQFNLGNTKTY
ncbi:MAG: ABC transporter permease, partial [Acidobacteriota bacterium]